MKKIQVFFFSFKLWNIWNLAYLYHYWVLWTVSYEKVLWELDCKECRMPKNWHLQTVVLEKTPESPLDSKEIKPVNLKDDQPWIFTGRTDAEAEALVFWSSDANRLIGKVPRAGKDCRQKEKRVSEDEMAGQYHWCNEHELGQTPGDVEGQESLACCSPWSCKELDMTVWLNNSMRKFYIYVHEETIMESTGKSLSYPFIQWF